jgi:hypothetical protein
LRHVENTEIKVPKVVANGPANEDLAFCAYTINTESLASMFRVREYDVNMEVAQSSALTIPLTNSPPNYKRLTHSPFSLSP